MKKLDRPADGRKKRSPRGLRITLAMIFCLASLLVLGGCKSQESEKSSTGDVDYFISQLTETDWQGSVLGQQVTLHIGADKEGDFELQDAVKVPFTYTVSDVSADNTQAKFDVTISDEAYKNYQSLLGGQIDVQLTSGKDLKLSINGTSATLSPAESDFQ